MMQRANSLRADVLQLGSGETMQAKREGLVEVTIDETGVAMAAVASILPMK